MLTSAQSPDVLADPPFSGPPEGESAIDPGFFSVQVRTHRQAAGATRTADSESAATMALQQAGPAAAAALAREPDTQAHPTRSLGALARF
jgi:hypothetical protein